MFSVLVQTLLLASSGIFSVGSISIVLFFLITDIKIGRALAYSLGYLLSYSLIGFVTVVINSSEQLIISENEIRWRVIFLIILGILLVIISRRKGMGKNRRFFERFKTLSAPKVFLLGMLVTIINLNNLALYLSSISVVSTSMLVISEKVIVTLLATLLFCLSLYIPICLVLIIPSKSEQIILGLNHSIKQYQNYIRKYVPLCFGTILIIRGVVELL